MTTRSQPSGDSPISVAIYARVAVAKQAIEYGSIDMQLKCARQYAKDRSWIVHNEYVDVGAAWSTDRGRPQFNAMLEQARTAEPPFTVILTQDHARLHRNAARFQIMKTELDRHGVRLETVVQPEEDQVNMSSLVILTRDEFDELTGAANKAPHPQP